MEIRPTIPLTIYPDDDEMDRDWIKSSWDLPAYKSDLFMEHIAMMGITLEEFRQLPVYKLAVENGLITNDKWTGGPDDAIEA